MNEILLKAKELLTPKKNQQPFYQFLPEKFEEFFDDTSGISFVKKGDSTNTDTYYSDLWSTAPQKINKYRQGVELTRPEHYFSGLDQGHCKIHSGDPGSSWKNHSYGQDKTYSNESFFQEKINFDPVEYLRAGENYPFPVVIGDNQNVESYNFNGVIEPLTIRAIASFFSIEVPFEAHTIRADVSDGNLNVDRSSDLIVTVYEKTSKSHIEPWFDMVDMVGTVIKIPATAYFNPEKSRVLAFNDAKLKVESSNNLGSSMESVVHSMNSSTENYISDGYFSAVCGFTYDDVSTKGTDSLAFGGYGY